MIDLQLSGTKKDDMLLSDEQKEGLRAIRKVLASTTNGEAVVQLIDMMQKTHCNATCSIVCRIGYPVGKKRLSQALNTIGFSVPPPDCFGGVLFLHSQCGCILDSMRRKCYCMKLGTTFYPEGNEV